MKFKVGDKVKIRVHLIHGTHYNNCYFNGLEGMYNYLGNLAKITKINAEEISGFYHINIDGGRGIWSEDMLELVEKFKKEVKPYGIVKFLEGII